MKLNIFHLLIFSVLLTKDLKSYCQEGNNWYFGKYAGISFNSGSPKALLNGALNTFEGCATISDKNGQLLFYTDGISVWNRNNTVMPNGTGLKGNPSSANAAIIIPKPGSPNIYYVITSDAGENLNLNGYNYSEIDISLNGGLGDVTANKNVLLYSPSTEKLTAVRAANGIDIWVITHSWGDNGWKVYKVDCHGISGSPVQSSEGLPYTLTVPNTDPSLGGPIFNDGSVGCLKASPDGSMLATTDLDANQLELFKFDNSTGIISNSISTYLFSGYGLEFSPNSKLLYVASEDWSYDTSRVTQFSLNNFNQTDIAASSKVIGKVRSPYSFLDNIGALQLGPDNKIYCLLENDSSLATINSPNTPDISCGFVNSQVNLRGRTGRRGLPVFFSSLITNQNTDIAFNVKPDCSTVNFSGITTISGAVSWQWDFGDGNTGAGQIISHAYLPGHPLDTVKLTVNTTTICGTAQVQAVKLINLIRVTPVAKFGVVDNCGSQQVAFLDSSTQSSGEVQSWHWDFGDGITSTAQNPYHIYSGYGAYNTQLVISSGGSCFGLDTIGKKVYIESKPTAGFEYSKTCQGVDVNFVDTSSIQAGTINKWFWNLGDGNISNLQNAVEKYGIANDYNIKLVVASSTGCLSDTVFQTIHVSSQPLADFKVSDTCLGSNTSYLGTGKVDNSTISDWWWDLGNETINTSQNPTINYISAGKYIVQFTVAAATGCNSDTIKRVVTIGEKPISDFSYLSQCGNQNIIYSDHSTSGNNQIINWFWDLGNGNVSTVENPSIKYSVFGSYPVKFVCKTILGCVSDTIAKIVDVNAKPVSSFSYSDACSDQTTSFEDGSTITFGNIFQWNWIFGDGNKSNSQNPNNKYPGFGKYKVALIVTSDKNCRSDTLYQSLNVETPPVASFNVEDGCVGTPLTFKNNSSNQYGGINEYYWDFGDGKHSDQQTPFVSYPEPGDYQVKLVASSANHCTSDTAYGAINIQTYPTVNFSLGNACINQPVNFTNLSNNDPAINISWLWDFSEGHTSQDFSTTYTFSQYGNYQVKLTTTTKNGCKSSANKLVNIEKVNIFSGNDTVVSINQPVQLSAFGASSYIWSPSEFLNNPNIANPIAIISDPITYTVQGTTEQGCTGFATINLKPYKGPAAYLPNAFTPDNNGINDIFKPIDPGISHLFYFTIYNRWGQRIFSTTEIGKGWDGTFNGAIQPSGTYVWELKLQTYQGQIIENKGAVVLIR